MAAIEFTEETKQQIERLGSADVVVGVAGSVATDDFQTRVRRVVSELGSSFASLRFVFTWPGQSAGAAEGADGGEAGPVLLPFVAPSVGGGEFWVPVSSAQRAVLALASSLHAKVCVVLGSDLAALEAHPIQLLVYAILERQCGLAMPLYPSGKYDALINSGILAPLQRALYGKRIGFPLSFEFAASGAMSGRLARMETANHSHADGLLWPATLAATQSPQSAIGQVHIDVRRQLSTAGLDLSAVLAQIVGSLFQDMETFASHWQRVRGSQPLPVWGNAAASETNVHEIDTKPMLDSFLLGSKNLDEVWQLLLPPNTMLELRRLMRLPPEKFRMSDELWAGIVYDFGLAYRLRTISRSHLLGALTPLYLGWVASYVQEISSLSADAAEQRYEQFARVWEEKKPYLLSRWRWPDRFNP
jgi:hypothetical protein